MDALIQDIRYALRGLRKNPGFALVAVLTIGLAIGATTTAFTWMERVVLHPLPGVPRSEDLVSLKVRAPDGREESVSYPTYRDWREGATAFEGIAVEEMAELSMRTIGPAQRVWGGLASANLFTVLHVRPALGRAFRADEEAGAAPVAVLSDGLWRRAFGGDSGVVGRHLALNGIDFTVIGVAPPGFAGATGLLGFDLWIPVTYLRFTTRSASALERTAEWLEPVARLRPGVSLEQARRDIDAVQRGLSAAGAAESASRVMVERTSEFGAAGKFGPVVRALLGIAVVVLLVACANLANLLLARGATRRREIGIRLAVGAGHGRLVRQLLTESALLALGGGVLGLLLAVWAKDAFHAFLPMLPFPIALDLTLNGRIAAFAAAASVLAGLAFGLVPALQASRADLVSALRDGAAAAPRGHSRMQATLVGTQVALSLVALVCAGLFVRSVQRSRAVDTGLREPDRVLLVSTDPFLAGYAPDAGRRLIERLRADVAALPGVRAAAVATNVQLGLGGWGSDSLAVDGEPVSRMIRVNRVGADYFETTGIALLVGRGITAADQPESAPTVVVNQAFVRRYWPTSDPLGRPIRVGRATRTVVGVVRDAAYDDLDAPVPPLAYVPIQQWYSSRLTLHVRAQGNPRALEPSLRRAFERIDPNLPFADVRTLAEQAETLTMLQRIGAWMMTVFGALALVLAAVGLYGVLSYSVSQRTREIGVRVALGASRRSVLGLVVGRALRLAGIGLMAGLVLAAGAGRLLRSQVIGISPLDPFTFAAVTVLLGAVALVAAWLPARRAARVDPIVALQSE